MTEAFKQAAHLAALGAQSLGLLHLLERTGADRRGLLHVLTYHRVAEPGAAPHLHPGLLSATPDQFARQMRDISRRHRVVSLDEVLESARSGRALPPRAVLITFDDAYADFLDHAWPVLQSEKLPAVLFVPTAFADEPTRAFWWDRLYQALRETRDVAAFKALRERVKALPHAQAMELVDELCAEAPNDSAVRRVLGWQELRELARAGLTLCPHTRTHPLLDRITPEQVRREVAGSREDLQREVGSVLPVLAYPSGAHDDEAVRVLEEEGYELAFTTDRGVVDLRRDPPLRLRRIPVGQRLSDPALRVQLLPQFARLNPLWATAGNR